MTLRKLWLEKTSTAPLTIRNNAKKSLLYNFTWKKSEIYFSNLTFSDSLFSQKHLI